ncbi:MAG TPA: CoB--CoM heterodisulfide reductase iron-sulfur subunit B family protein [Anaerolineae bacterium]|nr:CoB--CoM heterodisulfide reductase iron-sulfur subunit B family protein [Anaerolineae bacterium]HUM35849.1 CoB--CoM heterodisulfide reductase iron-sulfur subunit B family protein [Anaerolineae bacterium]
MTYGYYPGCSLLSSAKEYDLSLRLTFARLGIELVEVEDWNCCGAVHGEGQGVIALPARNLALAEAQGLDTLIAPCSGCYHNLRRASKAVEADKATRQLVNAGLAEGLQLKGNIRVLHPLYVLLQEYGLERIRAQVTQPLTGMKVAPYYGCMLTRPRDEFDSPERPAGLDELLMALGAEVVDYPFKAKCCGGAVAISHSAVTAKLTGKVLDSAKEAGAEMVTLACPMCHTALDLYQSKAERAVGHDLDLPVLYFTQLLGLALGIAASQLGFKRHIVSPLPQLARLGF